MDPELRDLLVEHQLALQRLLKMSSHVFGAVGYMQHAAECLTIKRSLESMWLDFTARYPEFDDDWYDDGL